MDKVVQQNAANAEESASASQEMNAQAEQMKAYVQDLIVVVGGTAGTSGGARRSPVASKKKEGSKVALPAGGGFASAKPALKVHKGNGSSKTLKASDPAPSQVIPFDDDDLGAF
jgi:methyl-accepting chemotaxis protein